MTEKIILFSPLFGKLTSFAVQGNQNMRIYLKVIPRASQNEIVQTGEGNFKVKVTAAPERGKANAAVQKMLAEHFGVALGQVKIIAGKSSSQKIVDILD